MTLLYGLKHFNFHNGNDCRIIIFPIANPSGFSKNQRVTYPSFIDPNRDFPI
jgi:predicted deacylase